MHNIVVEVRMNKIILITLELLMTIVSIILITYMLSFVTIAYPVIGEKGCAILAVVSMIAFAIGSFRSVR